MPTAGNIALNPAPPSTSDPQKDARIEILPAQHVSSSIAQPGPQSNSLFGGMQIWYTIPAGNEGPYSWVDRLNSYSSPRMTDILYGQDPIYASYFLQILWPFVIWIEFEPTLFYFNVLSLLMAWDPNEVLQACKGQFRHRQESYSVRGLAITWARLCRHYCGPPRSANPSRILPLSTQAVQQHVDSSLGKDLRTNWAWCPSEIWEGLAW